HSEGQPDGLDVGVAQWAFDHDEAAGYGTNTLAASPVLYVPLKAPMRMRGVLAIGAGDAARLAGPEQRRLLGTCASLLAISDERARARRQSGAVQLTRKWPRLEQVVGTSLKTMASVIENRRVNVALADDLPMVDIDAVLVERALCNLLENAGKYTPAGSPIDL